MKNNIQENDLESLEMFIEYSRLALEVNNEKPFQRLMFLIRDWENPDENSYGLDGGKKFLGKCLVIDKTNDNELQRNRRNITNVFSTTECFLMPHPGSAVINKTDFDGRIADIDSVFVDYLKLFVEHIFKEENLSVKKICGREVKGKHLIEYFEQYANAFVTGKIPEPKTILTATAEANNLEAFITAKELYESLMNKDCGKETEYIEPEKLLEYHKQYFDDALKKFNDTPKIGGDEFCIKHCTKLKDDLNKMYENYKQMNYLKQRYVICTGFGSKQDKSMPF